MRKESNTPELSEQNPRQSRLSCYRGLRGVIPSNHGTAKIAVFVIRAFLLENNWLSSKER